MDKQLKNKKVSIVLISLLITYVLGILLGSLIIKTQGDSFVIDAINKIITLNINDRINFTFGVVFNTVFLQGLIILAFMFLLGFFAYLLPIQFVLFIVKGISIGALGGVLMSSYGSKGMVYFLISVIIPQVIFLFLMLLSAKTSYVFKLALFNVKNKNEKSINKSKKLYLTRFAIIFLMLLMYVLIETAFIFLVKGFLK